MERRQPSYTVDGAELVQPLWKTVWKCLRELRIDLPCDPGIPVLGIYQRKP